MALDKDVDNHTLASITTNSSKFIKSFRIVQAVKKAQSTMDQLTALPGFMGTALSLG